MKSFIERLRNECHRDSTKKIYYNIWKNFNHFCVKLNNLPSCWEDHIVLFVGFLIQNDRQSSTIRNYLSAIHVVLAMERIVINEDRYLLNALTRACKLKNDRV